MNPLDPAGEPVELSPIPSPQPPSPREPFFDYTDLALFIGLCVPSLFIAALGVRGLKILVPMSTSVLALLAQSVWYFLAFGLLAVLFRVRYDRPFWASLGWRQIPAVSAIGALVAGPVLMIVLGLLGAAFRAPEVGPPFEQMLGSRASRILLGLLVVVLGPVAEELAFRGFLMPLLMRSAGAVSGILITGIIFGSAHGYEYEWSWQYMLLVSVAGCCFGWAKYKTQSTVAAALMHSTFNLTQFAALLARSGSL